MEQFIEKKSMLTNLQAEIKSLKNPVDDFTSKWFYTYEVIQMLRVSRRTMDNYIKAGKLTPNKINKRNYFAYNQVKGLMHIPEVPKNRGYYEDINNMLQQVARMNEMGKDWWFWLNKLTIIGSVPVQFNNILARVIFCDK